MSEDLTKDSTLGFFIPIHRQKGKGKEKGFVIAKMDQHCLSYILKGLNCRVDTYERMPETDLAEDDKVSFAYTKKLRDNIENARNSTLES